MKRITAILLVFVMCLTLCSCQESEESEKQRKLNELREEKKNLEEVVNRTKNNVRDLENQYAEYNRLVDQLGE